MRQKARSNSPTLSQWLTLWGQCLPYRFVTTEIQNEVQKCCQATLEEVEERVSRQEANGEGPFLLAVCLDSQWCQTVKMLWDTCTHAIRLNIGLGVSEHKNVALWFTDGDIATIRQTEVRDIEWEGEIAAILGRKLAQHLWSLLRDDIPSVKRNHRTAFGKRPCQNWRLFDPLRAGRGWSNNEQVLQKTLLEMVTHGWKATAHQFMQWWRWTISCAWCFAPPLQYRSRVSAGSEQKTQVMCTCRSTHPHFTETQNNICHGITVLHA